MMQRLPISLQDASMNYKHWKKRCKYEHIPDDMVVMLRTECEKVEKVFNHCYTRCTHVSPWSKTRCCWSGDTYLPTASVLMFANINSKTLYKICKRLQKTYSDPTPMQWLISIRALHVYEFLGGHHTTHLSLLHANQFPIECPLCLLAVGKRYTLIFRCGHHACISCTLRYVDVNQRNGAWYHLLMHAQRRCCPFCRYDRAFQQVTTV